jgi:nitrite reductase/ring-hydroxylating ferredoxin subunit
LAVRTKETEAPKGKEPVARVFVAVCRSDELPEGTVRSVKARGKLLAVGRVVGGQLFAVGGRCSHMFANLGNGKLEGTLLECPWHGTRFDVTDGCVANWVTHPSWLKLIYDASLPAFMKRSIPTFDIKEENGEVLVAVD